MPQQAEVDVVGLRALARDIARAGDIASPLNKVLKDAGLTAVSPIGGAVQAAIPQVETLDHEAGAMAGTVRIWSTRTGAGVREGTAGLPYAGPMEFGGWPRGRQFVTNGRYLFPAAGQLADQAAQLYSDALTRGFASFPWTNEGNTPHD